MSDMQGSEMGAPPQENLYGISTSLLRALQNEQDAHNSTKSLLERETSLREDAEVKIKRLQDHNQGLLNSIKLLQSTVKHMVQKENRHGGSLHIALEQAVQQYNKEVENTKLDNSILYDTLARNKANDDGQTESGNEFTPTLNFDLLDTLKPDDHFEKAEFQRIVLKQMDVATDEKAKDFNNIYHQKIDVLVNKSKNLNLLSDSQSMIEALRQPTNVGEKSELIASERDTEALEYATETHVSDPPPPMLELPASFLSKYGKRPLRTDSSKDEDSTSVPVVDDNKLDTVIEEAENKENGKNFHLSHSPFISWKVDDRHAKELRGNDGAVWVANSHFEQYPVRYGTLVHAFIHH